MHPPAKQFVILDTVDSTNNYAMGMIRDGVAKHGTAWFSYEQTRGKGRRGKTWAAQKGKNIMMSIALVPRFLTVYQQFQLSVAISLGCVDVVQKYAGDVTGIKWPNDIFWNDRKAGGILIENMIKGNTWEWAVIGIGININQTEFYLDSVFPPVSLKQITGKEYDIIELGKELQEAVMKRYSAIENTGFEKMLDEYNQHLFGRDKKAVLRKGNAVFETTIRGVTRDGKLNTFDTSEREFGYDEVEWIKS